MFLYFKVLFLSLFFIHSAEETNLSTGTELNLSLAKPFKGSEWNFSPAAHLRFFVLENASLGFFARHGKEWSFTRTSLGPSIRAYYLVLGPCRFNFSQTFALAIDRRDENSSYWVRNNEWMQSIARLGFDFTLNDKMALGLDYNSHSQNDNGGISTEIRVNFNYHFDSENTESSPPPQPLALTKKENISSSQYRFGSKSIGHLVSSNTNTLNSGEGTFGTLYTGYGITKSWSLGISPFVYLNFDIASILSRHAWDISDNSRIAVEVSYFKTIQNKEEKGYTNSGKKLAFTNFKMEASSLKLSYSNLLNNWYRLSFTGSYYHYFDDERPFSLRMDPQNGDPYAANFTSLHEFKLSKQFYINGEVGLWGINYRYPYYHGGLTLNFQRKNVLLGIGASTTFSPSFPKERARYYAGYDSRMSIHPELQAQLFF